MNKELLVNGRYIEVDYEEELQEHLDGFPRYKLRGNKLQSCSPFRAEQHPSFAVNLENGSWVDSGAYDEADRKGSFITLLAFLKGVSYEEVSDYLTEKYSTIYDEVSGLSLKINLVDPEATPLLLPKWDNHSYKQSDYLSGRGISKEVQQYFNTSLSEKKDAIVLPWHDSTGRIINLKYRNINSKDFWYSKGGKPVKQYVYGLFAVKEQKAKTIWIVESEIDCLYLWSLGIPSIALGGASISDKQEELIRLTNIDTIIIATDNDIVGNRFAEVLYKVFGGYYNILRPIFPDKVKDVNECDELTIKSMKNSLQIMGKFL